MISPTTLAKLFYFTTINSREWTTVTRLLLSIKYFFFSRNLSVSIKFVCYTVISLSSALIFMFSFDIVPLFVIKSITVFQNVLLVAKFLFLSICLKYRSRRPERCSLEKVFRKYAANWQENTMPKYDFNKVAKQLYWNHTSAWVFSFKVAAYFQNNFS